MQFYSVRYRQSSKCFQTPTLLRMSVDYYSHVKIWCNIWMHFFHKDMAKNIFIMIVFLTLKCGEVKAIVKGPQWHVKQNTNVHRLRRFKKSSY